MPDEQTAVEARRAHTTDAAAVQLDALLSTQMDEDGNDLAPADENAAVLKRDLETKSAQEDERVSAQEGTDTGDDETASAGDEAAAQSDDETADADEGEAGTFELTTVADLAEALDIPVADVLSTLKHKVGDAELSLADIAADYGSRSSAAAESEAYRAFAAGQQQRIDDFNAQSHVVAQYVGNVRKGMTESLTSPEMADLRMKNPGEWAARTQDINRQVAGLDATLQNMGQQYDTYMKGEQEKFFQAEATILQAQVDGWGMEKLTHSVEVIRSLGFGDAEIQQMGDHRLHKAALELRELRQFKADTLASATATKKAVTKVKRAVPKMLTPGAKQAGPESKGKAAKISNLRKRLAKSSKRGGTGNVRDAANLFLEMGVAD